MKWQTSPKRIPPPSILSWYQLSAGTLGERTLAQGAEAAVMADPERRAVRAALAERGGDGRELLLGHGERLLDVGVLAGLKRQSGVAGVAIVTGRHHDRVDLAIAKQLARVGGGLAEAVSLGERLGVGAFGRADAFEAQVRERGKTRHEHGLCVIARADLPEPHRAARLFAPEGERARLQFEHAFSGSGYSKTIPTA